MKKTLTIAIIFAFSVFGLKAQTFNPLLAQMLQDSLNAFVPSNVIGISASVYIPGQGLWQGTKGVSYTGVPITTDMGFGIASNTKLFTGVAMLMLQENGVLDLDDSLSQWLPGLNPSINPNITIRQLLNHTSGIPDVIFVAPWQDTVKNNPTRVFSATEVVGWVTSSSFPAGTNTGYSNTNYILAGMIAQNATGFHISKIIRDSILTPLNMDSTFYDVEEPAMGNIAHRWWDGLVAAPVTDYSAVSMVGINSAVGPAGAMFSTSSEMTQWYNALFSGQVLSPSSMIELTTFTSPTIPSLSYSMGLQLQTTIGFTYWGHAGSTWGYKSKMVYDPCSGTFICTLTNSFPNGSTSVPILLLRVVKNHVPLCPGAISGTTTVCPGQTSVTYTVPLITNATSYIWTLPNGATGTSSTNSITVNYGALATTGEISVTGNSVYGVGNSSSLAITVNPLPANAGAIVGSTTVCQGQNSVTYTVPVIANASTYVWALPNGATGTSSTNSITIDYSFSALSGNISVNGSNACGDGTNSNLAVSVNSVDVGVSLLNNTLTANQNGATYQWVDCGNANVTIAGEINQNFTPSVNGNYAVILSVNGCTDTSACSSIILTGLSSIESSTNLISVYPNPSSSDITFQTNFRLNNATLVLTDCFGRTVAKINNISDSSFILYRTNLVNGLYFAQLIEDNRVITTKKIVLTD